MTDAIKIGRQIALLRKASGLTQEELADRLHVTPQAISKWENGHSLPETALLPPLALVLDTSIDALLCPGKLSILEALWGDGLAALNCTKRLARLVEGDVLDIPVCAALLGMEAAGDRPAFLTIRYGTAHGVCYAVRAEDESLHITGEDSPEPAPGEAAAILAGRYGSRRHYHDILPRIRHLEPFAYTAYRADHHTFPSNPANDGDEYLTLVYLNAEGIHMVTCREGESLAYAANRSALSRVPRSDGCFIADVPMLPPFGSGMECSWAAALTAALQAMGIDTAYEEVMGVSGACYRLAFHVPAWDYSAVDGLVAYDYATPGYAAFGYTPELYGHIEKADRAGHRERIMKGIREGMPSLGINLRVAHEWGVICGYAKEGEALFCRTKYDEDILRGDPDFVHGALNPYDYLYVDNWPFLLCYFTGKRRPPSARENLLASLRVFTDCAARENAGHYAMGFAAYAAWADGLRDDAYYGACDGDILARRFSVNQFCALALMDARACAHAYLHRSLGLLSDPRLARIAGLFHEIAELSLAMHRSLDSGKALNGDETHAFWTKEKRFAQAARLDSLARLERDAFETALSLTSEYPSGEGSANS